MRMAEPVLNIFGIKPVMGPLGLSVRTIDASVAALRIGHRASQGHSEH